MSTVELFLERVISARDVTDINIAAGEAHQALQQQRKRRLTKTLWGVLIALVASDLLPIGPLDLGLLPNLHVFQWAFGHPLLSEAHTALYHTKPEAPHILGVPLPWHGLLER